MIITNFVIIINIATIVIFWLNQKAFMNPKCIISRELSGHIPCVRRVQMILYVSKNHLADPSSQEPLSL